MEAKLLREARRTGVKTPHIIDEFDNVIEMEFVEGEKVKDALEKEQYAPLFVHPLESQMTFKYLLNFLQDHLCGML